jgi:hypothetical protein
MGLRKWARERRSRIRFLGAALALVALLLVLPANIRDALSLLHETPIATKRNGEDWG